MVNEIYTYRHDQPESFHKGGLLSGLKVVIQPCMSVRGWLCNAGSSALEGYIALQDATVVKRLIGSGAVIVGSARMSELGLGLNGDTSVDIVARGEADVAFIMDIMGESRLVAAESGLFGLKPSYGVISRLGLIGLVPSMEVYGIVARHPSTILKVITVIAGEDGSDPTAPLAELDMLTDSRRSANDTPTVGVVLDSLELLNSDERQLFDTQIESLTQAGAFVKTVALPDFELFRTVHQIIAGVEASSCTGKYDGVRYGHRSAVGKNWNEMYLHTRGESFGTSLKSFLFQGAWFQFHNYEAFEKASQLRSRLLRGTAELLGQTDFLAFPAKRQANNPFQAVSINEIYDAFCLTLPANVIGQPSLYIPGSGSNRQFGLQLNTLRLGDNRLLSFAAKLLTSSSPGV